jgi:uncharacterized membrane protein YhaH (DUF805 family)
MDMELQVTITYLFIILFFVYVVLAVVRKWKEGAKEIGKELLQAPLRILLALGAFIGVMTEQTWVAIVFISILFLTVYFTTRKHKEEIKEFKKEREEEKKKFR